MVRYRMVGGPVGPLAAAVVAVVILGWSVIDGTAAGFIAFVGALTGLVLYDLLFRLSVEGVLADGVLELRAVLRCRRVPIHSVRSIALTRAGEGGRRYSIAFEGGSAVIGASRRARQFVDQIVAANPALEIRGPRY